MIQKLNWSLFTVVNMSAQAQPGLIQTIPCFMVVRLLKVQKHKVKKHNINKISLVLVLVIRPAHSVVSHKTRKHAYFQHHGTPTRNWGELGRRGGTGQGPDQAGNLETPGHFLKYIFWKAGCAGHRQQLCKFRVFYYSFKRKIPICSVKDISVMAGAKDAAMETSNSI